MVIDELAARGKHGHREYLCVCDCGYVLSVRASRLSIKNTTSCGCYRKEKIAKVGREERGEKSSRWKGDKLGYTGLHARLQRMKGKASDHLCVDNCGRRALDWSYKSHEGYSTDPADYVPRCRSCHMKRDKRGKATA